MAVKLVKPLRMDEEQDPSSEYPIPLLPGNDGIGANGFFPQNASSFDQLAGVERDVSGNLTFKDAVLGATKTLSQLATAASGVSQYDFLLDDDPVAGNFTYAVTYSGSKVTKETWTYTATGKTLKTSDYTYSGNNISVAVTKIFATDGVTVVAQTTETYAYSGNKVTGSTKTRDI